MQGNTSVQHSSTSIIVTVVISMLIFGVILYSPPSLLLSNSTTYKEKKLELTNNIYTQCYKLNGGMDIQLAEETGLFRYPLFLDINIIRNRVAEFGLYSKFARSGTDKSARLHSLPLLTGDGFRALADIIIDTLDHMTIDKCSSWKYQTEYPTLIIYVNVNIHVQFFNDCFEHIDLPMVLITHNGDLPVPDKVIEKFLHSPNLLHWYGQNTQILHPKLTPIPLGLENRYNRGHGYLPEVTLSMMTTYATAYPATWALDNRYPHTWAIFNRGTHPVTRDALFNLILEKQNQGKLSWMKNMGDTKPFYEFYRDIMSYAAMVCPRGNGLDTHRAWESLYLGRMIIIQDLPINEVYRDLPAIVLKEWTSLDDDNLVPNYTALFLKQHFNTEKLFMPYWICLIGTSANRKVEYCGSNIIFKILSNTTILNRH